jgi:hypothetical protein
MYVAVAAIGRERQPADTVPTFESDTSKPQQFFKFGSLVRLGGAHALVLWKPLKNFQAPPNEIGAEYKAQGDFEQLDYEFVLRHGRTR